jgi:predicted GIY-YIG superfamily endonuclease
MVHWVYVLKCDDGYIYVGETSRLFKRFTEHLKGRGGINTVAHTPRALIGLYKVNENHSFMKYRNTIKSGEYNPFILQNWDNDGDNLLIENHITERYFYERRDNCKYGSGDEWYKVRGGKYTKQTLDETVARYKLASEGEGRMCFVRIPIDGIPEDTIMDRPMCKCGYLSEVKLSKDKCNIYFVCSLKNVWGDFFSDLHVGPPCDFWQLYTEDRQVKHVYETVKVRSRENWVTNIPLSRYKIQPEPCIACNKVDYLAVFNSGIRRLCQQCIITKYTQLKDTYDTGCLIDLNST